MVRLGLFRPAAAPAPAPATPLTQSSSSEQPSLLGQAPRPAMASLALATTSPSPSFSISAPPFIPHSHTESCSLLGLGGVQGASPEPLVLRTLCELPAVARGRARDSFAVLVHARAPATAAVREAWIAVACPHPGVRVRAVKSSTRRRHEGLDLVASGRGALLYVGGLRAGQERRFLLFLNVPTAAAHGDDDVTRLARVSCTYQDAATGKSTVVAGKDAVVRRPAAVTSQEDQKPSVEVQVERFRVQAATRGPFATPSMKSDMMDLSERYVVHTGNTGASSHPGR